ncbi:STAS domain-containing protein [Sporosarcina sp. Marseille-Q4063]|uniref:RsbT co-antagonist protein RsbRA n=1 Tax=Sporosarcina sp. Marseille-Q4063 TaxID=2810514 RepID=UPI001BAF6A71|nr:RsbT co-antagonist protein RsbRA [Sporosarcina sp. Marseille-Q4063]QUW23720.1 STAS domain-containing protein [Sporosarcina sp. Marseille-Q4063]
MNNKMVQCIHENLDGILERWEDRMKDVEEERFFHFMPDELIDKTSREFAELMTSNLHHSEVVNPEKLADFTEKVVRFGWSIKFVNKSIENFSDISFEMMEEKGVIDNSNVREYMKSFSKWISPLRESIIDAYAVEWERTVKLQRIALQELSASLIPVFEKISVMPLVGTIDTERAKLIMENILEGVVKQRAEVVLLDITGVPVVDTMVAHHIIQAADAVRLIGAKCMLVGIRPEIAQTIVALGIELKDFTTTSTLQRGMQEALKLTDRKIVEVEEL